jgi:sugar phosphate isomerase/epimerase
LPPYEGTIDWEAAVKTLKTAPDAELPLTLELKEKSGHDAPSTAEQLAAASESLDRFEREWS